MNSNNQPQALHNHHHHHHNNNNNYLNSSPIAYQTLSEQPFDSTSHHYHQIQHGLSALLQQREQILIQQHHHHNSSLNQWELKEKTIHHILEKLSNQKMRLAKKLKKLKQDVYRMHQIEKSNKMNHQIGGKPKQQMPPPQLSMTLSSQQVLATPLSLLLDDPSIGDSQNPISPCIEPKDNANIRNVQQTSSVNNQRKRPIQSVNLTANSTTSAAPYSIALDATPSDGHTYSEMPSSIRGGNSSRKQIHNSVPNSSSTLQATNSSIVFTNNPSY